MKTRKKQKRILGFSIATFIFILALLAFIEKMHVGVYNA